MNDGDAEAGPLECPRCARRHESSERFCRDCGMPLIPILDAEPPPASEMRERARKIRPAYARGELRRIVGARNIAEAELIQGMLLEEGIPSILRRTRGFDVPDFLAAGPRDVLVAESGYEAAHQLLADHEMLSEPVPPGELPGIGSPARLAAGVTIALAIVAAIVWALSRVGP